MTMKISICTIRNAPFSALSETSKTLQVFVSIFIFYEICFQFYGLIRVVKTFSEAQKCRYGVNSRQRRIFCTQQGTAPSRVLPLQQKQHQQQSQLSKTLFCSKSGPKYVRYRTLCIVCLSMVNLAAWVFSHKMGQSKSSLPNRTWSRSNQTFIFSVFRFWMLSLKVCSM